MPKLPSDAARQYDFWLQNEDDDGPVDHGPGDEDFYYDRAGTWSYWVYDNPEDDYVYNPLRDRTGEFE